MADRDPRDGRTRFAWSDGLRWTHLDQRSRLKGGRSDRTVSAAARAATSASIIVRRRRVETADQRQRPPLTLLGRVRIEGVTGSNPLSSTKTTGHSHDRHPCDHSQDHLTVALAGSSGMPSSLMSFSCARCRSPFRKVLPSADTTLPRARSSSLKAGTGRGAGTGHDAGSRGASRVKAWENVRAAASRAVKGSPRFHCSRKAVHRRRRHRSPGRRPRSRRPAREGRRRQGPHPRDQAGLPVHPDQAR